MQPNLIQASVIKSTTMQRNDTRGGSATEVLTLLLPNPAHMHGIYLFLGEIHPRITLVSSIVVLILQLCDRKKKKLGIYLTRDFPHHLFF